MVIELAHNCFLKRILYFHDNDQAFQPFLYFMNCFQICFFLEKNLFYFKSKLIRMLAFVLLQLKT